MLTPLVTYTKEGFPSEQAGSWAGSKRATPKQRKRVRSKVALMHSKRWRQDDYIKPVHTITTTMQTVLDYGNVCMRKEDFDTLENSRWLKDTIIDFAYEYCERDILFHQDIPYNSICLLRPGMMQLLTVLEDHSELKSVLPASFWTARFIFLPVNDSEGSLEGGGSHWSLLVYSTREGIFHYYDSLMTMNLPFAQEIARKVMRILRFDDDGEYFDLDCQQDGEFLDMDCPQQTNGADCGMWVIIITLKLFDLLVDSLLYGVDLADWEWIMRASNLPDPSQERVRLQRLIEQLHREENHDILTGL